MGIKREYIGDFTEEQTYFDSMGDVINIELNCIRDILNNIEGDNIWNSIQANESLMMIKTDIINRLEKTTSTKLEDANNILTGIDGLLSVYKK